MRKELPLQQVSGSGVGGRITKEDASKRSAGHHLNQKLQRLRLHHSGNYIWWR
ncbi:MAG: E3 binding domain-containing protein [Cytophagales bacterium]|nr:E3 binding domain-containing protein [Cytophagales bacterium]